jgi:hypothetical protein
MPIPKETLGLREASERFGVSVDTLRRRIKDDALPEAFKADGKFGTTWVVPIAAMADIADRERWVLKLDIDPLSTGSDKPGTQTSSTQDRNRAIVSAGVAHGLAGEGQIADGPAQTLTNTLLTPLPTPDNPMPSGRLPLASVGPQSTSKPLVSEENLEWVERLLAAETRATGAETRLETMEADALAAERRIGQLTRDLEHERAELRRLRTDLAAEDKAKAVAVARTDELRGQLKRDRLDLEARIGVATAEARTSQTKADELQIKLGNAHAAMGWWSKRRLNKVQTSSDK